MGKYVGYFVWRGWGKGFSHVKEVGEVAKDGAASLVPVRYTSGQHGVFVDKPLFCLFGWELSILRELRPDKPACRDAIRYSSGMPEVIAILGDCYKIGVNEGEVEEIVFVRRGAHSVIHEQVVVI